MSGQQNFYNEYLVIDTQITATFVIDIFRKIKSQAVTCEKCNSERASEHLAFQTSEIRISMR
jgi:hypothetical protein